ncbi:tetratricopeptide repeat protein [bacterium]|nr:MAG: tetratricopeptide repeat protein [bacterium]
MFKQLRARGVFKGLAVYLTSSLALLGAANLFSNKYDLSSKIFDGLLAVLLCGLPAWLLQRWVLGAPVRRPHRKAEVAVYGVCLAAALVSTTLIILWSSGAPAGPRDHSIAVLPFQNMSDSREDEYFSDGVTEDIIAQLSKIGGLKVISRTSVMPYKGTKKGLRQIGQELGASAILEGSVRRAGDKVRIVGQLIDARTDRHLWAETYDRGLSDVLAIQSDVARQIARELRIRLSPVVRKRLETPAVVRPEAYAAYLRGRESYYRYTAGDNERAVALFQKALEIQPDYALAFAGLGDTFALRVLNFGYPPKWLDRAMESSQKAIELNPDLAEGYKALGLVYDAKGDLREALRTYEKALDLNPNYAPVLANIGSVNYSLGRFDEALRWLRSAAVLQPGVARTFSSVGLQYYQLRYDEQAASWLEKALSFQPEAIFPKVVLAFVDLTAGRTGAAREKLAGVLNASPENATVLDAAGDVELIAGRYAEARDLYEKMGAASAVGITGNKLAFVILRLGDDRTARKILERNIGESLKRPDLDREGSGPDAQYGLAESYLLLGKTSEALDSLEAAFRLGYRDRWLTLDPLFGGIRKEPRFLNVASKLEEQIASMRKRVEELGLDR